MKNNDKGKSQILPDGLFKSILQIVGWSIVFFALCAVLSMLLMKRVKEFSTAAFIVGLIAFFVGIFSMSRGSSQDFNVWSFLGSRCVQSMQDPGNENYAKRHMQESIFIPNKKSIALTIAGIAIFLFSFF